MEKIRKILIGGDKQVGKTYIVQRLIEVLRNNDKEVKGYCTYMQRDKIDEANKGFKIYMYPAQQKMDERTESEDNFVGRSTGKERIVNEEVFANLGVKLLTDIKKDEVVIMDEVGFFEANVKAFSNKVFEILESGTCVIATIKEKYDNEYINKVRGYKEREDAIFVQVTKENREDIFAELEKIIKEW